MAGRRGEASGFSYSLYLNGVGVYLVAVWALTAVKGYAYYRAHHAFAIGDWLINAHGGWVRRALCGEVLLRWAALTGVNPGLWVWLLEIAAYGAFFAFAYALLRRQEDARPFVLLVFSPFIFTFQLHGGGYRKEILYFVVLGAAAWALRQPWEARRKRLWLAALVLVFPLLVLSHELLLFFLPYVLGLYLALERPRRCDAADCLVAVGVVLSLAAFASAVIFARTSPEAVQAMLQALAAAGYPLPEAGALGWLTTTTWQSVRYVLWAVLRQGYLWKYALVTALMAVAYFPLRHLQFALPRETRTLAALAGLVSLAVLPIMVDWGRMLYMHGVSVFFYALAFARPKAPLSPMRLSWRIWLLVAVYALGWYVPPYALPPYGIFDWQWLTQLLQAR